MRIFIIIMQHEVDKKLLQVRFLKTKYLYILKRYQVLILLHKLLYL